MISLVYVIYYLCTLRDTSAIDLCSFKTSENDTLPKNYTQKNIQTCSCENESCIRVCCKPGYFYWDKTCHLSNDTDAQFCIPIYKKKALVNRINETFSVGLLDCLGTTYLLNKSGIEGMSYIQENGQMLFDGKFYTNDLYCYDAQVQVTFICGVQSVRDVALEIIDIAMYISMPLLFATFTIYLLLPVKTNHHKALMSYVMSLLIGYISLKIDNYSDEFEEMPCLVVAVIAVYFILVSFLWINIMCFDIWVTFKNILPNMVETEYSKRKKFKIYSTYAWGLPLLFTIGMTVINNFGDRSNWYHPNIGTHYCFVEEGVPRLVYFYGPMTLIIIVNTALFIMTSTKIFQKRRKERAALKQIEGQIHNMENDQNFYMYVKLMLIMGINWSLEIISWVVGSFVKTKVPYGVWIASDFCNAIYGSIIFIIYGFNRKVWRDLRERYGGKNIKVSASVETMTTTVSFINGSRGNIANTTF